MHVANRIASMPHDIATIADESWQWGTFADLRVASRNCGLSHESLP
jgi:hypothetical protein